VLHRGVLAHRPATRQIPPVFSPSTEDFDPILSQPSSYPLCEIASHRPDSIAHAPLPLPTQPAHSPDASPHQSTSSGSTVSPQVNEPSIIPGHPSLSYPTKLSEIGDSSQPPAATSPALPVHTSPHSTDTSPPATVAAALQDISPAATLPHPLEGTTKRDIVAPCTEPDLVEILSTASLPAPTLVPVLASTPPVPIKSLESCDPGVASTVNPLLPASSIVGLSIPASPPPSRVPPLPNAESLSPLSSTTHSHSTGNAALPRLRDRGLVNTGSMCFANAVLQLLVHSPPFRDLFRELGDLKGPRGAGVLGTSDGATPLVDATLRFLEEFMFKQKEPPPSQELPQQVAGGKAREDEETKKEFNEDSFKPMYMYNAMKEKRQLKKLLVRSRAT
jgi:ubiquitin carboxyl-terminal hydrolase 10